MPFHAIGPRTASTAASPPYPSDSVWVPEAGDDEDAHPAESPGLLSAGAEPEAGDDECGHGLHRTSLHT